MRAFIKVDKMESRSKRGTHLCSPLVDEKSSELYSAYFMLHASGLNLNTLIRSKGFVNGQALFWGMVDGCVSGRVVTSHEGPQR